MEKVLRILFQTVPVYVGFLNMNIDESKMTLSSLGSHLAVLIKPNSCKTWLQFVLHVL